MSQYIFLGTQDLSDKVYSEISPSGGYFDIKQVGTTSLRTGCKKGDPKGFSLKFSVCFTTSAETSAFLAYVTAFDPDSPDFDEDLGADIPLYIRDAVWHYQVYAVVVKPEPIGKEVMDYIQYQYEVVCYCYSPYSDAVVAPLDFGSSFIFGDESEAAPTGNYSANQVAMVKYQAPVGGSGTVLRVKATTSGHAKLAVYSDNAGEPNARLSQASGAIALVAGWNDIDISSFEIASGSYYWIAIITDAEIIGYRNNNDYPFKYKSATYSTWTWPSSAGTGYSSINLNGPFQIIGESAEPNTSLDNSDGHISSAPDLTIVASYNSGRAEDLTVAIADGLSLVLADQCNSAETWGLIGNASKLLQTYEDAITAGTQWGRDWVGSGTFDTDHMELDNGQSAYIILSGPHQAKKPVKMTADLSLDSGGATGEATVDISPDGIAWQTALTQDDFETGSAEYPLAETYGMTDIYVRISCNSGTSGKKVNIGSVKFEVERWIPDGDMPTVALGQTKVLTVSATGGTIAVSGTFTPRRKFL